MIFSYVCEIDQYFLMSYFSSLRGLNEATRGWSVSLLAGEGWTDLAGCDFVMDLLAGEEADVPLGHPSAQTDYLFSNTGNRYASIELSTDSSFKRKLWHYCLIPSFLIRYDFFQYGNHHRPGWLYTTCSLYASP